MSSITQSSTMEKSTTLTSPLPSDLSQPDSPVMLEAEPSLPRKTEPKSSRQPLPSQPDLGVSSLRAEALGRSFNSSVIEEKLRALNCDISFDPEVRRPSDYHVVGQWNDRRQDDFMGVYWCGRFVTVMDRGQCPEHCLQEMEDALVEIPMSAIDKHVHDEPRVAYVEILPSDPGYHMAMLKAERKDDNYSRDDNGKVFRYQALIMGKKPGRICKFGWRKTLCALVECGAVSQRAVETAFGVRL